MSFEWKYFVWRVEDVYSTNSSDSPVFEVSDVKYFLSFKLIPSKNTSDDMLVINFNRKYSYLRSFSVCTFVLDGNGDSRFVQKVSVDESESATAKTVWEMNRRKFIEEGESLLEAKCSTSNTVKFVCVLGPVGSLLKDTMWIQPFASIHLDRSTDCCERLSGDFSKILESESFSDIVLKCGGKFFCAHKAILSTRSGVFSNMIEDDCSQSILDITDIDVAIFTDFLGYVYSGKRPALRKETAPLLYKAGDKYEVETLKTACAAYMVKNLNADNACDFLLLASSHSDKEFKASVISFIIKEENCILKQESWRKFGRDHPTLALEVYDARVMSD